MTKNPTKTNDFGFRIEISTSRPGQNHFQNLPHLSSIVTWPGDLIFASKMRKRIEKCNIFQKILPNCCFRKLVLPTCRSRGFSLPIWMDFELIFRVFGVPRIDFRGLLGSYCGLSSWLVLKSAFCELRAASAPDIRHCAY